MAKQVLIVDDNPNMSSLLQEMLEVFDYESVRASDGEEALAKVNEGNISLIITDMRMPKMSGLELIQKVKEQHPKLPIVLISGYTVGIMENEPSEIKPDGFLGKPLSMSEVEKMLNTLL